MRVEGFKIIQEDPNFCMRVGSFLWNEAKWTTSFFVNLITLPFRFARQTSLGKYLIGPLPKPKVDFSPFPQGNREFFANLMTSWERLPSSANDWTREQLKFVHEASSQLAWWGFKIEGRDHQCYEKMVASNDPLVKKVAQLFQEKRIYFECFREISDRCFTDRLSRFPCKELGRKLAVLCQLEKEGNLSQAVSEDKLTLSEYYFLTCAYHFRFFSKELTTIVEQFEKLKERKPKGFVQICFLNLQRWLENDFEKAYVMGGASSRISQVYRFVMQWFFKLVPYGPTNFLMERTENEQSHFFCGIGPTGIYEKPFNAPSSKREIFQLNFEKIFEKLNVPDECKTLFKCHFESHIELILKQPTSIWANPLGFLNTYRLSANEVEFRSGEKVWCNEFVWRVVIQALLNTLDSVELEQPSDLSFFGVPAGGIKGITPTKMREILVKEGLITLDSSFSDFVDI